MNLEQAYIKSMETKRVIEIVDKRLNGNLKKLKLYSKMEVPDAYDEFLENDMKRKIAISYVKDGWITIVESKRVNDYTLLLKLSEELQTEVLAVVQHDAVGAWGFVEICNGKTIKSYYSEEDDEVEDLLQEKQRQKGILQPFCTFKEIVKDGGWKIIQANNKIQQ